MTLSLPVLCLACKDFIFVPISEEGGESVFRIDGFGLKKRADCGFLP